jgi:hypothetical protein
MGFVREELEGNGSSVTQIGRASLNVDETWSVSFHLIQASRFGRGKVRWVVPRLRSTADILVGIRMDAVGERPMDYLILPAVSAKTWPGVICKNPWAKGRFYLFPSLQMLRELAELSRKDVRYDRR